MAKASAKKTRTTSKTTAKAAEKPKAKPASAKTANKTAPKKAANKAAAAKKTTAPKKPARKTTAAKPASSAKKTSRQSTRQAASSTAAKKTTTKKPAPIKNAPRKIAAGKPAATSKPAKPSSAVQSNELASEGTHRPPPGSSPPSPAAAQILGQVCWLMMQSPAHKHMFVTDMEWLAVPAVVSKQFRLYRTEKSPWAFVSWALLDAEVENRLMRGHRRLRPGDWNCGDRPRLIDVICPFGGADRIIKNVREAVFPGKTVKALISSGAGKPPRVVTLGAARSASAT